MKITEVRIFPTESKDGKLKAFATMTFDDWFVVRNVKVIQGNNGLFVAMPSRKAMDSCPKCRFKNAKGSKFCNQCGAGIEQKEERHDHTDEKGGDHMDIAHPITQECRVYIQEQILEAYDKEFPGKSLERAEQVSKEEVSGNEDDKPAEKIAQAPAVEEELNDIEL